VNPPRLLRSGLTGSIYIVTRYKVTGIHPETGAELITASQKFDVTEQFRFLMAQIERESAEVQL
jgi:hypothetical protein